MLKTPALLSLCVISTAFCADDLDSRISALEARMSAIKVETAQGTYGAQMATARPVFDGYGLFATADLLVWHLKEDGTDYALTNKKSVPYPVVGKAKRAHFDWDVGFRVGVGYEMEHDAWVGKINFTWFQTHASNQTHSPGGLTNELGAFLTDDGTKAKVHWKVAYYVIDLEVGRPFFVSKFFSVTPQWGIETAWIFQHATARYLLDPPIPVFIDKLKVRAKNNFWGIGPRAGFDANWYFCRDFRLFGSLNGAILWGHFDVHDFEKESGPLVSLIIDDLDADLDTIVPNAQMALGFGWDSNICEDRFHVGASVSYEFQYWWRQNQMLTAFQLGSADFERVSKDLTLNGVTIDVRFDF